ncbi:putative immunoglobulin-like domain containing protein [Namao virus]|nr:putative immunoglobulin-like domain containing protein [Namao virus]
MWKLILILIASPAYVFASSHVVIDSSDGGTIIPSTVSNSYKTVFSILNIKEEGSGILEEGSGIAKKGFDITNEGSGMIEGSGSSTTEKYISTIQTQMTTKLVKTDDLYKKVLDCDAKRVLQHNYRRVTWYKVTGDDELTGIVSIRQKNRTVAYYAGARGRYEVTESNSLVIVNPSKSDCGTYQCQLWADLGQQNQKGNIEFKIEGCADIEFYYIDHMELIMFGNLIIIILLGFILWYAVRISRKKSKGNSDDKVPLI